MADVETQDDGKVVPIWRSKAEAAELLGYHITAVEHSGRMLIGEKREGKIVWQRPEIEYGKVSYVETEAHTEYIEAKIAKKPDSLFVFQKD